MGPSYKNRRLLESVSVKTEKCPDCQALPEHSGDLKSSEAAAVDMVESLAHFRGDIGRALIEAFRTIGEKVAEFFRPIPNMTG